MYEPYGSNILYQAFFRLSRGFKKKIQPAVKAAGISLCGGGAFSKGFGSPWHGSMKTEVFSLGAVSGGAVSISNPFLTKPLKSPRTRLSVKVGPGFRPR